MSWPRRRSAASSSSRAGQPGVSATVRTLPLAVCSRRQLVVALTAAGGALAVSGCVVRPLYGTAGDLATGAEDGAAGLAGISIRPIPNRSGQMLHNQLRDLLNPRGQPSDAVYDLEVALRESIRESGLRRTETATRGTLTLSADYRLLSREGQEVATYGRAQSIVGFNLVDSGFANHVSRQSAQERAIREVAQEIRRRLALYLADA